MPEVKYFIDGEGEKKSSTSIVDRLPDYCPLCHFSMQPIGITGLRVSKSGKECLEIVFQCPRYQCRSLFFSYYVQSEAMHRQFKLQGSAPSKGVEREFENEINEISEEFSIIYNQAMRAEELGLDRVAGMGYRKAFEFLIKDYLISEIPEKETEIKNKMLGACIKTYITNEKIKQIAERAAWLGNDESHYERKWIDKDVEDLKRLIEITAHYITMEKQSDEYINSMQH